LWLERTTLAAGGIHDAASLQQALSTGCGRVVLATASLGDLDWVTSAIAAHGERVAVGLDVRVVGGPTARHPLVDRGDGIDRGDLWDAIEHLDAVGCAGVELCRAVVGTALYAGRFTFADAAAAVAQASDGSSQ
jgi:phosphoribosylformimino-5-aminoimidazole carboxamide ribonucleotide (ProFAR) isomerase